jgi:hypothetical protein
VNKESESIWKEAIITQFEVLPRIFLEELGNNAINLRVFFAPRRNLSLGTPEWEA